MNDDCLGYILQYLSDEERIHFAQTCRRFRQIFTDCYRSRYKKFSLDMEGKRQELTMFCICRESVTHLTINIDSFDRCVKGFQDHRQMAPTNCFEILCANLKGMEQLQRLIINKRERYNYPLGNLWQLQNLHELYLDIQHIDSQNLVKCCKTNANLRVLHLGYGCVHQNLANIFPHCRNLEELKFGVMAEATEYCQIARLPKLTKLTHFGVRRSGSFALLLSALNMRPNLQRLFIDGGSLTLQEAQLLTGLRNLREIKCFCSTADCVALLSQLTALEGLSLWMSSSEDISDAVLGIISSCKELKLLRIASAHLRNTFVDETVNLLQKIRNIELKKPLQLEIPHNIHSIVAEETGSGLYVSVDYEPRLKW
ncbi:uncharacterized protein LOC115624876 [Scaptodrosophila lebanonensis]|uniref:Uncharacterized protein LOC115624876 n=1 Tax=Drosophila lebanonensis TaxID=7225 RepID=A0A6J2TFS0_DROLE|nr:uncharacterized protein LOC115624876 [Scaptodrosophila lebanonensis]